jgi:molybdopterin-guanine dinucleotide biosynthesis protein A
LKKSAIVLAGGLSNRFGHDKGLLQLAGKPLILHVLDKISTIVDEVLIVVGSARQAKAYAILNLNAKIVIDKYEIQSPLVGAITGFENANGEYSLLLPCDTPFVSSRIASLLLEKCVNRDAVIPRWPNGYIEPLQAAYRTKSAITAANTALENKKLDMRSMIANLGKVTYTSTLTLKQVDPNLVTFFNINTPEKIRKAEAMIKGKATSNC